MYYPERGEHGELRLLAHRGFTQRAAEFWAWVSVAEKSTCGQALLKKKRVSISDLQEAEALKGSKDLDVYLQEGVHACQTTPLYSRNGNLVGMISTHWRNPHKFQERDLNLLDILARQAADLIERVRTVEKLQRSEQQARALVDELKKVDDNKDEFLAVLSHELRNPLAAIMMSISMLKHTGRNESTATFIDIIDRQSVQLSKLVDDLLDITRINRNKISLKKEELHINQLIQDVVDDYRASFEDNGIQLDSQGTQETIVLYADPTRLRQALGNLLHNALKFTPQGGRTEVSLSKDANSENAIIHVKDTGVGIAQGLIQNLFQSFTQADKSLDRGKGGLGLGLAIVKGLVELHGGKVSASSQGLNQGAEFTLYLPINGNT